MHLDDPSSSGLRQGTWGPPFHLQTVSGAAAAASLTQPRTVQPLPPRPSLASSTPTGLRYQQNLNTVTIWDLRNRNNWVPGLGPADWNVEVLERVIAGVQQRISVLNASQQGFRSPERALANYEIWFYTEMLRSFRQLQAGAGPQGIRLRVDAFLIENWRPLFGGQVPGRSRP
jgi:hypothetical protein